MRRILTLSLILMGSLQQGAFAQTQGGFARSPVDNTTIDTWSYDPVTYTILPQPPRADRPPLTPDADAPLAANADLADDIDLTEGGERFREFSNDDQRFDVGTDLYSAPDFVGGLIVFGDNVAMKIGGYVKADFIYDFDPIDNTDAFDTSSIPVGVVGRTNSRFHARQTRLSFDTRWLSDTETVHIYVEGDFFSEADRFRLRQAYGEVGDILVGRTWTTFTDVAAAPNTLDFEGSVSSVNRRQALARWKRQLWHKDIKIAVAVEDTRFIIKVPDGVMGEPRSPSPDLVARLRFRRDWGQFQFASVVRMGGYQVEGMDMQTGDAWGFNFSGVILLREGSKAYYQFVFGEGIGSYRGLPDAAPTIGGQGTTLGMFGWMVGATHEWNDQFSSNLTYAENSLDNTLGQPDDDIHRTTYMAVNLLWHPFERVTTGVEYLYGVRENVDRRTSPANRIQMAVIFDLP